MCGRTACTLDKNEIQHATCQYSRKGQNLRWIEKYDWQSYKPSYNLSPSQISPVIVNNTAYSLEEKIDDYIITPMRWGLIPSWFKGNSLQECSLKTNNCRLEGLLDKPTFKGPANSGRRCVILADGFYEWKEITNNRKQPYFIYFPQEDGPDIFCKEGLKYESDNWRGPELLTMAGIFDVWKTPQKETIYSYSVITMDSSKTLSFVHHRMPAILTGKDEVSMWLDVSRVPIKTALSLLKPVDELQMHPVSTLVSSNKNNTIECLQPLKKEEKKSVFKKTALTSWLLKNPSSESPAKRFKTEK